MGTIMLLGLGKLNGGTTSSNSDGKYNINCSCNTTAGFSIVSYTGNGSAGATVGHGLGAKPDFYILKKVEINGNEWLVHTYNKYDWWN